MWLLNFLMVLSAGRANGCEVADAVDVGVLDEVPTTDEVPNYSKGGVELF